MKRIIPLLISLFLAAPVLAGTYACQPTPEDEMGPFYRPGAPLRDSVGSGYLTRGTVRSAKDCRRIPKARIEFWMADDHGRYTSNQRATWFAGEDGSYQFSSNVPSHYTGRPPHIHIRVTAPGFVTLVTQHYPKPGATEGTFDLILQPD